MADYTLKDGKGTSVREDGGSLEGYVDFEPSGLSAMTDPSDSDVVAVQRSTNDPQKLTLSNLWEYIWGVIGSASDKPTAVGADILMIQDSEDSDWGIKELTLTNLKKFLDTVGTYDTLWVGAGAMVPTETNGATTDTVEYETNDITHDVMVYSGADNDTHAEFDVVMPPSWDRGTVKFKVYWTNGHADANADEYVGFYVAAGAFSNDDPLDAALGSSVTVADQLIADDDLHVTSASAAVTVGGTPALGDLIHFKLSRDYDYDGGGTAMDVDAYVLGILIQYQRNKEVTAW